MNDFDFLDGENNFPGLSRILFAPVDNVSSIPSAEDLLLNGDITLTGITSFYTMYGTIETMQLEYAQENTEHGEKYNLKVSAFIANLSRDPKDINFDEMKEQKFIVVAIDENGKQRLFGSLEAPMFFTMSASSGAGARDRNGASVTFYGESDHVPYYLLNAL